MKRSSCLFSSFASSALSASALLVGLSMTTASFAAPPDSKETKKAAPARKAKKPASAPAAAAPVVAPVVAPAEASPPPVVDSVQSTDPPPAEGGATPAPAAADPAAADPAAAAPATGAAEGTPTPAITIGNASGTPGADAPNGSAADPAAKPKPRPFAGTQIYATTSMTTATVFKGQQQDYNPTVDSSIWLLPRYAISEAFQLRGRLIFNYEYTNSDSTATRNEPRFSDTSLQLFYRKIPELPGGIKPMVSANVALPTSPESRARTMIFSPGATLQLSKTFEHVGSGEIMLLASAIYSHPIYRSTTPETRTPTPYSFQCVGGNSCQDQLSGTFNPSDSLAYAFLVAGSWGKWSPALYYLGASQWAYTGSDVQVSGRTVASPNGFGPTNVRQTSYFSAWLDYEANSWFTAEVGYWLSRSALAEDSTRGNPFFDRFQDQRVYIGANFNIDNIMKQLEGGPVEGGIVRAQNTKKPIWNF